MNAVFFLEVACVTLSIVELTCSFSFLSSFIGGFAYFFILCFTQSVGDLEA